MPSYDLSLAYLGPLSLPMPTLFLPMLTYAYLCVPMEDHCSPSPQGCLAAMPPYSPPGMANP